MIDIKQLRNNISKKLHAVTETDTPASPVSAVSAVTQSTTEHASSPVSNVKESRQAFAIGSTINIKGDVTGDEDLVILGHVEGRVDLKEHNVTIGPKGSVNANINAKQVVVEGILNGDITGEEKVVIRKTGNVLGNIISPRVTLEDGAMFKGSIEMEPRNIKSTSSNTSKSNVI